MKHLEEFRNKRRERKSRSQTSAGNQPVQPEVQESHRSHASPSSSSNLKDKDTKDSSPESNELIASLPEDCQRAVIAEIELLTNKYLSPSRSVLSQIVDTFPAAHEFIPIDRSIFNQRFVQLFGLPDPDLLSRLKTKTDADTVAEFKICKPEEFTFLSKFPVRPNQEEVRRMENDSGRVCMHFTRLNHMGRSYDDLVKLVIQALYYQFKLEQTELYGDRNGFIPLTESKKLQVEALEELVKPFWKVIETKMGIPKERLESAKLWAEAFEKYMEDYLNHLG